MSEKRQQENEQLLGHVDEPAAPRKRRSPWVARVGRVVGYAGLCYGLYAMTTSFGSVYYDNFSYQGRDDLDQAKCPAQPAPLAKGTVWNPNEDEVFAELAAKRLSKAIQIDTESFDSFPQNASDPAWDRHYAFSEWLTSEFSKLFTAPLEHEYVNTHGHLFTWPGSDPSLKPIVFMAHIDVVPVLADTRDQWTFPPFSGTVAKDVTPDTPGTWIWGRGASDCKNSLIGIYSAVERLVTEGFVPERTIIIANGFDEEVGGRRGAGHLAKRIEEKYGPDSIAFVVDEGFSGLHEAYGATFAAFGMAEKGAFNLDIRVETPGGHSSVPPEHTAIGVMSLLLAELEANPFPTTLDPRGPYVKYLSCLASYAPDLPDWLRKGIQTPSKWPKLANKLAKEDRIVNSFLSTTQAIDIIRGGVKINALPEVVEATINHRIAFTSNVAETLDHIRNTLEPVIDSLNFTVSSFGANVKPSARHVTIAIGPEGSFESAPITSPQDPAFALLAATTRAIFGKDVVVSPTGMFANTDTRHYWNVTHNIYRFTPAYLNETLNQHTVDERVSLTAHLNTTRFYYQLIQNTAGWEP